MALYGNAVSPALTRGLLSCWAAELQWHVFLATARGERHEGAQECHDGNLLALHGRNLRLAALVLRAPLCPMPINAQVSIAIPARKSVDKARMSRDLRAQTGAILPLVAPNGALPEMAWPNEGRGRGWATGHCGRDGQHNAGSLPAERWGSAAPGAAHALANALRAVDDTAGRDKAAHPAGEGRQAAAIRA